MSRYRYTAEERDVNAVLAYQRHRLEGIELVDAAGLNARIKASEELLCSLGYELPEKKASGVTRRELAVPTWEQLVEDAKATVGTGRTLESLFTEEELLENETVVRRLAADFDQIHQLDEFDVAIAAFAGILAGVLGILLVGIPGPSPKGVSAGPLSDHVRRYFERRFPGEEMRRLEHSAVSKVPFDAQDNRNTTIPVDGLCTYYHRLYSLGHDPLLGFLFGVVDIMTGRMTTIDKSGQLVSQVMEVYADRRESSVFAAIAKECCHLKSDLMTSMGLPAPAMGLFNLLQFGSIGEEEQTIAEIVQGMYYQGYDFIHFCSMSLTTMLVEVVVRVGYAIKRVVEGSSVVDAIPVSMGRESHPKLGTMLFVGHAASVAINAGKVLFAQNPMAINYPQWLV